MEQSTTHQREQEDSCCTLDQNNMDDEEALDCPVCLEPYNEGLHNPKMMPCLHTLCASCIASLTSSVTQQNSEQNAESITTSRQHPLLRRVAGRGPTSPTTRQPQDPLPPITGTSPTPSARPPTAHKPRGGLSVSVKRPEVSPPQPPKPGVAEPQIPKDVIVQCPLCRSDVSTSKLQTNRYVLAHMRDLARLSMYSPCTPHPTTPSPWTEKVAASSTQPTSPPFPSPEEFWCGSCKQIAINTCAQHELMPLGEWVETQKATLESLHMAVEDQLGQHTVYLHNLEVMMKNVYYSLNKASRFAWHAKQQVEELKEELECQPPIPTTENTEELIEALMGKVTQLKRLAKRVSKKDLTLGNSEVMMSYKEPQQLFISTNNPDFALVITVTNTHTSDV